MRPSSWILKRWLDHAIHNSCPRCSAAVGSHAWHAMNCPTYWRLWRNWKAEVARCQD